MLFLTDTRKTPLVNIFFYLFENYNGITQCPDALTLARRMTHEGFDENEVRAAVLWVEQLKQPLPITQYHRMAARSQRIYHMSEIAQIGQENLLLLAQLEVTGSLDSVQRERIVERCMLLPYPITSSDHFKALLLTVLWAENHEISDMLLHVLLDQIDDIKH